MSAARTAEEMREAAALVADAEASEYVRDDWRRGPSEDIATRIRALPVAEVASGIDLAAIGARERDATPGPWEPNGDDWRATGEPALVCAGRSVVAVIQFEGTDADAAFIAHAREDVPALIAEVRRLRAQMAEARGVLTPLAVQYEGCDLGSTIALALAALSHEAPLPDTAATGGAVDSDRGGEPSPEEMARLDAGQTTTMRALRAGALTEARDRAERAEAESERWRALAEEYRAAHREGNDIV